MNGFQSWYGASLNEAVAMSSHIATASTAVEKPRFVRAYAPLLGECKGIDEAIFLDDLYKSSQVCVPSPGS